MAGATILLRKLSSDLSFSNRYYQYLKFGPRFIISGERFAPPPEKKRSNQAMNLSSPVSLWPLAWSLCLLICVTNSFPQSPAASARHAVPTEHPRLLGSLERLRQLAEE